MNRNLVPVLATFAFALVLQASLPAPSVAAQAQTDFADDWTWPLSPWENFVVGDAKNGGIGFGDRFVQPSGTTLHGGIDAWHKAGDAKTAGQPVYAMANGTVSYLCNSDRDILDCQGFGKAVLISHNLPLDQPYDGATRLTSVYGHLDASKPIVKLFTDGKPTKVTKGQIIGYLAPTGRCGSICTSAHIHFGIRKGHFGEAGFPSGGWGYVPLSDTKEFSQWINPIDFIRERQKVWRTETQSLTFFLPWWRTFYTCDSRRIKVSLDSNQIFYTSSEDGSNPSTKASVFVGFGNHTLEVEVFDYTETPAVGLSWPLAPVGPTCAVETIPTPVVSTPTRVPIAVLTTVPPATHAPVVVLPTTPSPTRTPTTPTRTKNSFILEVDASEMGRIASQAVLDLIKRPTNFSKAFPNEEFYRILRSRVLSSDSKIARIAVLALIQETIKPATATPKETVVELRNTNGRWVAQLIGSLESPFVATILTAESAGAKCSRTIPQGSRPSNGYPCFRLTNKGTFDWKWDKLHLDGTTKDGTWGGGWVHDIELPSGSTVEVSYEDTWDSFKWLLTSELPYIGLETQYEGTGIGLRSMRVALLPLQ